MSESVVGFQPPTIKVDEIAQIADGVWVIPDSDHRQWVPNIGIIVGSEATLVIDTGLGTANAEAVLEKARELSAGNRLLLTLTHFHPEHGYGSHVFDEAATIFYNEAQWLELQEKGRGYRDLFVNDCPEVAPLMEDVVFLPPKLRYSGSVVVDLGGGLRAECREFGGGHSRGDQAILVTGPRRVLFTGDLVEDGYYGVLPDEDSHVKPWLASLIALDALGAEIVVGGHGLVGDGRLISDYREIFQRATDRTIELRAADELSEDEIVDQVTRELLDLHPDWRNQDWARVAANDLRWPARP